MEYVVNSKGKSMSKSFLLPLLEITRTNALSTFKPTTYLYWEGSKRGIDDYELLVHYKTERNKLFDNFEKKIIITSPYIQGCYEVDDGVLYSFDVSVFYKTVQQFLEGKYSEFSKPVKAIITRYWNLIGSPDRAEPNKPYFIAMYPEYYMEKASIELGVDINELPTELCGKFDPEAETFKGTFSAKCCEKELFLSDKTLSK